MKHRALKAALMVAIATLLPVFSFAQDNTAGLNSLEGVLNNLYDQMIPLCSQMIGIGQGIAGFAAMFYIAVRVWRHIAAAEPVDFYPLLRPFVIGFCISIFPQVLTMINGVLSPTVTATQAMVGTQNTAVENILNNQQQNITTQQGSASIGGDPDKWYQYSHPDNTSGSSTTPTSSISDEFSGWGISNMIKKFIYYVLNICFEAAALCIDTIRTFKLIVLAILGPLCFGLSVFDGFQHTLKQWLARYVNVYMWLPVANIFGAIIAKIQVNMNLAQQAGTVSNSDLANTNTIYLIFLLIGIVGYFTVPSIAGYIINVGGHALLNKTTAVASTAISFATGAAMNGISNNVQTQKNTQSNNSYQSSTVNENKHSHLKDRLSGKT
jgi:conjugative transposon TraJ protein